MDTPDRAAAPPAARAEDSPLFSFIESLSPIEPLKSAAYSTNSLQTYQSLNITSVSSIFTSPHVASSLNEGIVDPPSGANDLPHPGQFDAGSPDHNTASCHGVVSDLKKDKCWKLEAVQTSKNNLEKRKCLFSTNIKLLDACQSAKDNSEVLNCEWEDFVSATRDELLPFNSSVDEDHRGVQLAVNNAESCRFFLSKITGVGDISDRTHHIASNQAYCHELVVEDQTENAPLFPEYQQTITSEEIHDNLGEENVHIPLGYKFETQQQQCGVRRRCLVFETAGYSNRMVQKESVGDQSISTCKGRSPARNHKNPGKTPSPRILRGIGLHLNALALTSRDKMESQDSLGTALVPSLKTEQDVHGKLVSASDNFSPTGRELLELKMDEDDCLDGGFLVNDHISSQSSSPQKKRHKADKGDDGDSCKHCSCKKSKCLKLYCECFAAGVYCSEPCTCQGCLNKPIHEEIVLSTRKQIEFRNPLAFAPKVNHMSDSSQETQEDPNNTPASARHKRGCNCKKSTCLKKYCECYQGGVGCSSNCRCESCKNTFGMRDGAVPADNEEENNQQKASVQNRLLELVPITPPFDLSSSLLKRPKFSNTKPPRPAKARTGCSSRSSKASETVHSRKISKGVDSGLDEDMTDTLREPASPPIVKTSSSNGKRVSPPHNSRSICPSRKGGRKLILKSIPSFPSLLGDTNSGSAENISDSTFSARPLALGPS